tara:strand:+ start:459 stop:677 length:219 start_codon:yes stop_codon:yes gene_type:complete
MTELFLVNMVYRGGNYGGAFKEGDWICFRSTHCLADATDMADALRSGGNEVRVQSVLIGTRGQTEVDLAKLN